MIHLICRRNAAALTLALALTSLFDIAQAASELRYRSEAGDTLSLIAESMLANPAANLPRLRALNPGLGDGRLPAGTEVRIPTSMLDKIPRSGVVVAAAGEARVDGREAEAGMRFGAGSAFTTGESGQMTLRLPDGSELFLPARSRAQVERLAGRSGSRGQDARIRLDRGRLESRVAPQRGPAARYRIETPTAVIGVRGTDFRVIWDDQRHTALAEVTEGRVAVSTRRNGQRLVDAGQGLLLPPDAPASRVKLPAAPVLPDGLPKSFSRSAIRLPLPPLGELSAWRVMVVATSGVQSGAVFVDQRETGNDARIANLPDGNYHLLVRGIDGRGVEGLEARHAFTMQARPEPPFYTQPASGKATAGEVLLSWTGAPEAESYRLEVAGPDGFDAASVIRRQTGETRLSVPLQVGAYQWRIASVSPDGRTGPWSDPMPLSVRPSQGAPTLVEVERERLHFIWSASDGQRYDYEFAADPDFSQVLASGSTGSSHAALQRPGRGIYYMRVRAVDSDGFKGGWSGAQRVEVPSDFPWLLFALPILAL